MIEKNVKDFWRWFKSISDELYLDIKNIRLIEALDKKIKNLGPFDWEIGPLDEKLIFFAVSPNLNMDLLKSTKEIISYAPECKNWTFLSAKPKKEYTPIWRMTDDLGNWIEVDTSSWSYILYHFEDGTFDMDLQMNSFNYRDNLKRLALDIVLTNILGEENYMFLVQNVKIVDHFEDSGKMTAIKYLYNHIMRTFGSG